MVRGLCTIFSIYMVNTALGMLIGGSNIIVARGINFLSSGLVTVEIVGRTLNSAIAGVIAVFLSGLAAMLGGRVGASRIEGVEAAIGEEEKKTIREEKREFPRAA